MTPARLAECQRLLGWNRRWLARLLDCSDNTLRQMEAGKQAIPPALAGWLEKLVRLHESNPPPDWRTRAIPR